MRLVPVTAGGPGTFSSVTAGDGHTCAVTSSREVFCWGSNATGQLGDGTTTDRLIPGAIPLFSDFNGEGIDAGGSHTCGRLVLASDQVVCWGSNASGQLGDGSNTRRLSPAWVSGGLTFASISAGADHSCGVRSSGAAYCWGENAAGQLGDGTSTDRVAPAPVSGGHAFRSISSGFTFSCGVRTDGKAYCWGENTDGRLGTGTTTNASSPALVGP